MGDTGNKYELVIIGGSSGGIEALLKMIPELSPGFRIPIVIIMHQSRSSRSSLAEVLQSRTKLIVREPEDKEKILPGHIYVSPPDYHLLIEEDRTFSYSFSELVNYSRPSIDVLFECAADVYRERLVGILITGSNHDGAAGMKRIKDMGGLTIVEDPATADSPTMPQAALKLSKIDLVLPIKETAKKLNSLAG